MRGGRGRKVGPKGPLSAGKALALSCIQPLAPNPSPGFMCPAYLSTLRRDPHASLPMQLLVGCLHAG